MPISITCECGKAYRVADKLAGRRAKCKACGRMISIESPKADQPLEDILGELPKESAPVVTTSGASSPPRRGKKTGNHTAAYAIVGAAALLLVLTVVAAIVFWPDSTAGTRDSVAVSDEVVSTGAPAQPRDESAASTENQSEDSAPAPGSPNGNIQADAESDASSDRTVGSSDPDPSEPASDPDTEWDAERDFPSIPRAMTEVPRWLQEDEPLFDYAVFFAGTGQENTGKKEYLDALFEFYPPPEDKLDLVLSAEETTQRVEQVTERLAIYDAFVQRHGADLQRLAWWAENTDEVTEFLGHFQPGLDKIATAQQGESAFDSELSFLTVVNFPNAVIRSGEIITFRALQAIGQRRFEETLESLHSLLHLVRDVRRRGQSSMQRVAYQLEQKALRTIVPPLLALPGLGTDQYDRVMNLMVEHARETPDGFAEGFKADYITARKALHDFRHRVGQFAPDYMILKLQSDRPIENAAACLNYLIGARYFRNKLAFQEWRWSELDGVGRSAKFNEFDATANALTADDYLQERAALNRCYGALLNRESVPRVEHYATLDVAAEHLTGTTVAMFLEPDINDIPLRDLHSRALIRGAQCVTAIYRWYAAEKNHPETWEDALQAAGIDVVPDDPFADGEPFVFLREGNTSLVYSIGPDRKDGGGRKIWYGNPRRLGGDIAFRCQVHRVDQ